MAYSIEECKHEEYEDCMFCRDCGSGCREDLDDDDCCPNCKEEPLETILNSYINGQRKQMAVQINEYGVEFWRDFANYLTRINSTLSRQLSLYQAVTIHYNVHFPHINQQ